MKIQIAINNLRGFSEELRKDPNAILAHLDDCSLADSIDCVISLYRDGQIGEGNYLDCFFALSALTGVLQSVTAVGNLKNKEHAKNAFYYLYLPIIKKLYCPRLLKDRDGSFAFMLYGNSAKNALSFALNNELFDEFFAIFNGLKSTVLKDDDFIEIVSCTSLPNNPELISRLPLEIIELIRGGFDRYIENHVKPSDPSLFTDELKANLSKIKDVVSSDSQLIGKIHDCLLPGDEVEPTKLQIAEEQYESFSEFAKFVDETSFESEESDAAKLLNWLEEHKAFLKSYSEFFHGLSPLASFSRGGEFSNPGPIDSSLQQFFSLFRELWETVCQNRLISSSAWIGSFNSSGLLGFLDRLNSESTSKRTELKLMEKFAPFDRKEKAKRLRKFFESCGPIADGESNEIAVDYIVDSIIDNKDISDLVAAEEGLIDLFSCGGNNPNLKLNDYTFLILNCFKAVELYLKEVLVQRFPDDIYFTRTKNGKLLVNDTMNSFKLEDCDGYVQNGHYVFLNDLSSLTARSISVNPGIECGGAYYALKYIYRQALNDTKSLDASIRALGNGRLSKFGDPSFFNHDEFIKEWVKKDRNEHTHADLIEAIDEAMKIRKDTSYWMGRAIMCFGKIR